MNDRPTIEDIARVWAIRASAPEFREWETLLDWLGGDPERNRVYNLAAAMVADSREMPSPSEGHPTTPAQVSDDDAIPPTAVILPMRPRSRRWMLGAGGMAIAASVAGALLIGRPPQTPSFRTIEAPEGRAAAIALADGSRIELAGGTRMHVDLHRPREVRIERGRAFFLVRHDERAPFRVTAGAHRIVDIGTSFEVAREGGAVEVAVSTGKVVVDPESAPLPLGPGEAAELAAGGARRMYRLPPQAIGQWRFGRMSYRNAPLHRVAIDLSAALGHPIIVDPALRMRRFDGTVIPATVRRKPADLATLLDVRVVVRDGGWELRDP